MNELTTLIADLEKAVEGSAHLDLAIWRAKSGEDWHWVSKVQETITVDRYGPGAVGNPVCSLNRFTRSMDDARILVPDGYDWGVQWSRLHGLETWVQKSGRRGTCHQGYAPEGVKTDETRAIALCIAALYAISDERRHV